PRNRLEVVFDRRVEVNMPFGGGADDELLHVQIGRVQQAALLGAGHHGNRVRRARGAEVRAFERVYGDVNFRERLRPGNTFFVPQAHFLADVKHGGFITFTFTDDDFAAHRHRVHNLPHGFDGNVVRVFALSLPHGVRRGDGGGFDDAQEIKSQFLN